MALGTSFPPTGEDLGARLGISRMTLRLALKALESTGYIVTTRGSRGGSRVTEMSSSLHRMLEALDAPSTPDN